MQKNGSTIRISLDDIEWINEQQPSLVFFEDNDGVHCLKGKLCVCADYNQATEEYSFYGGGNPPPTSKTLIQDEYFIEIRFCTGKHALIAQVIETNGKLESISKNKDTSLGNLHINPDNTACMHAPFEIWQCFPNGLNVRDFVLKLLLPFFYDQSYYDKNGFYPNKDYDHGDNGKLASLYDQVPALKDYIQNINQLNYLTQKLLLAKKIKRDWKCICLSGLPFSSCHSNFHKKIVGSKDFTEFKKGFRKYRDFF